MHAKHGSDTAAPVIPLRPPRQWWVVHTPEGYKALNFRPHLGTGVTGPFLSRSLAEFHIQDLKEEVKRRRWTRAAMILLLVWAAVLVALLVAP